MFRDLISHLPLKIHRYLYKQQVSDTFFISVTFQDTSVACKCCEIDLLSVATAFVKKKPKKKTQLATMYRL